MTLKGFPYHEAQWTKGDWEAYGDLLRDPQARPYIKNRPSMHAFYVRQQVEKEERMQTVELCRKLKID